MFALLNWRVLLLAALVCLLSFTHFSAYRAGKATVRAEFAAATAAANIEAFKASERRQRTVDVAATASTARKTGIAAAASNVGSELVGLRNAIDTAERVARESTAAADHYRATCSKLLIESGELLKEVAASADGHASDVRLLLDSWPR